MRAWIVSPVFGSAVIALAISSVEARDMTRHRGAVSRHVAATPGRFVIVSSASVGGRVLVFDRFLGRFVTLHRRGFAASRKAMLFGFVEGLSTFDGFVDFGNPAVVSADLRACFPATCSLRLQELRQSYRPAVRQRLSG
jgi:hypothetical protein